MWPQPSVWAVNDGEDVCVPLGGRKEANKVNMKVGETTGRKRNGGWRNLSVSFGGLAGKNALFCPEANVLGHVVPQETGNDEMEGGSDTGWV